MTLSNLIKLKTNDGETIIDFLIEVMHDCYEDFQICHRLQAARAPNDLRQRRRPLLHRRQPPRIPFQPQRTQAQTPNKVRHRASQAHQRRHRRRTLNSPLPRKRHGRRAHQSFKPHHRISAARELLDRGFGKSARAHPLNPTYPLSRGRGPG